VEQVSGFHAAVQEMAGLAWLHNHTLLWLQHHWKEYESQNTMKKDKANQM
jgi:hypothetical protein